MEGGRREEERQEVDPLATPSTSILPESSSPERIATDEPVHIEDTPTMDIAGSQATTTDIAGGETVPPQQTQPGNQLSRKCFFIFRQHCFLSS
jgi:hypothetical protein